jgi:hypothetical protein
MLTLTLDDRALIAVAGALGVLQLAQLALIAYLAGELRDLAKELAHARNLYLSSSPKVLAPPNH